MQKQEQKLKRKLWKKDSVKAQAIFGDIEEKYASLRNLNSTQHPPSQLYSGHLDSLKTSLSFLQTQFPGGHPSIDKLQAQYSSLQAELNVSEQIRKQLQSRQQMLKEQFEKLGMVKQLKQYRKQVYYYQSQVRAYKEMFEDPSKMEARLMELAMKIPAFKDFFAKHSGLGQLFAVPGSGGNSNISLTGLQTRASVNQSIVDRFGSSASVTNILQQNVQGAQGQLNALKQKAQSYASGSYGDGDPEIPGFKPNNEKTKSLLDRLEFGANMQSQKARYYFPVTSDIALSLGYKLNDRSIIGIGAAYKIGWGRGWDHLRISHQGIGLRSYIDWQIKGSIYLSGGYEQNYQSLIRNMAQLQDYSAWQSSGLIGLSKRYRVSKKFKGEMKVLWDFLSYRQVPRTQGIVFRVGYSLK